MDGEALAVNRLRNCSASLSLTLVGARWKSELSVLSLDIRRFRVVLLRERRADHGSGGGVEVRTLFGEIFFYGGQTSFREDGRSSFQQFGDEVVNYFYSG